MPPGDLEDILQALKESSREGRVREARYGDWQADQVVIKTKKRGEPAS
jgi:hypothetical protein